jgi:hypothetical protein
MRQSSTARHALEPAAVGAAMRRGLTALALRRAPPRRVERLLLRSHHVDRPRLRSLITCPRLINA